MVFFWTTIRILLFGGLCITIWNPCNQFNSIFCLDVQKGWNRISVTHLHPPLGQRALGLDLSQCWDNTCPCVTLAVANPLASPSPTHSSTHRWAPLSPTCITLYRSTPLFPFSISSTLSWSSSSRHGGAMRCSEVGASWRRALRGSSRALTRDNSGAVSVASYLGEK
jgi:hypothetical protein